MPYFSVIEVYPHAINLPPECRPKPGRLVKKYGGTYVARTKSRIITAWPSEESARAFINDPECVQCLDKFIKASAGKHYLIEAKDQFALVHLLL